MDIKPAQKITSLWCFNQIQTFRLELGGVRQARAIVQRMGDAWEPQQQATVLGSFDLILKKDIESLGLYKNRRRSFNFWT